MTTNYSLPNFFSIKIVYVHDSFCLLFSKDVLAEDCFDPCFLLKIADQNNDVKLVLKAYFNIMRQSTFSQNIFGTLMLKCSNTPENSFTILQFSCLKFVLSEKHTKFKKIFLMVLTNQLIYLVNVKTMRKDFFKLCVLLKKSEL